MTSRMEQVLHMYRRVETNHSQLVGSDPELL